MGATVLTQRENDMPSICLNTAIAITGLSRRTLWRRINDGDISTLGTHDHGGETRVNLDDVLPLSSLPLEPEDHAVIVGADAGDAVAQCELALIFLAADRPEDALPWMTHAAKQFYPDAMCYLGRWYLSGELVPRDEEVGLMWLAYAGAKGHPLGQALTRFLQIPGGQALRAARDRAALDAALDRVESAVLLRTLQETADPA
jgi:hypothetical protein